MTPVKRTELLRELRTRISARIAELEVDNGKALELEVGHVSARLVAALNAAEMALSLLEIEITYGPGQYEE